MEITLKKNNRIRAYYDDDGQEYARFYVMQDGKKIGQIQWGGSRSGWGYTESRRSPRGFMVNRVEPWTQAEAIEALQKARIATAEFIKEKLIFF